MNIIYRFLIRVILERLPNVADFVHREPKVIVEEHIVRIMKMCWIVGTIIMIFGMTISYILFLRRLVGCIRLQNGVYLADRICAPFTMGVLCPKIYLPVFLKEEYYPYVILHERVHISRKDVWMKYLAVVFLGLFWFQPLLWYACHLFLNDMEEECDETVIRRKNLDFREKYARALVEVSFQVGKVHGAAIGYGNGAIKSRIQNIMNYKKIRVHEVLVVIVLCMLFAGSSVLISWQVPRIVQKQKSIEIRDDIMAGQQQGIGKEKVTEE